MRKRIDIMTDIETLGTGENVPIIQLSAIAFDINTGEELDKFNEFIDISKCRNLIIDGSTLKWWLKTDKELLHEIIEKGNKRLGQVLQEFNGWVESLECDYKNKYLWGNGILFDNRIIQDQMIKLNLKYPIFYRSDRDVRTILDLACEKAQCDENAIKNITRAEGKAHDAFIDVKSQINLVCFCHRILMETLVEKKEG